MLTTSHPSRVRGLKRQGRLVRQYHHLVAPITGAWIETDDDAMRVSAIVVAPITGAWIET